MAQLRQDYSELKKRQVEVLVVGPEDAGAFQNYWRENDLPYPGLPDPQHRILKLYGQEVNLFRLGRLPAQVLIDRQGIVRFVHYGKFMSDIPSTEEILQVVDELHQPV